MKSSPDLQHTGQHEIDLHNKVAQASTTAGHPVQASDLRPDPVHHLENAARAVGEMTKDPVRIAGGFIEEGIGQADIYTHNVHSHGSLATEIMKGKSSLKK